MVHFQNTTLRTVNIFLLLSVLIFFHPPKGRSNDSADSLERLLLTCSEPDMRLKTLVALSSGSLRYNYPSRALVYVDMGLSIAQNAEKHKASYLQLLIIKAEILKDQTDLSAAMSTANQARLLALQTDNDLLLCESLGILGRIEIELGEYDHSSANLFDALKLAESSGNRRAFAKALNDIGVLFFEQHEFDRAKEYYTHSLAISQEENDIRGIARGLNNLAAVISESHPTDTAFLMFQEAARIDRSLGYKCWEGIVNLNIGDFYSDRGDFEQSLLYNQKAIEIFKDLGNHALLASTYLNLSDLFNKIDDDNQRFKYLTEAFELGKVFHLRKIVHDVAARFHDFYLQINDLQNAYQFGMLHYQMKDSLELEKSLVKISRIELQHEFDKQTHEQKIQHQRFYFLVVIVILVLIVVVVIILLHLSRQKLKVKEAFNAQQELLLEIEKKNRELTMSVMTMIKKNETITEINAHLIRIDKSGIDENGQQAIAKISRELQKSTEEEFWKDFEARFIQVHGEFYGQLRTRFPGLTPNEVKLCAFLRLKLSSKEISQLTGQQISTIEIARHRLRLKLGISNTQINLVNFIAQL